jgi:hypothetical protein
MEPTADQKTYETAKTQIEAIIREIGHKPEECAERVMQVVCTYHVPIEWWSQLRHKSPSGERR